MKALKSFGSSLFGILIFTGIILTFYFLFRYGVNAAAYMAPYISWLSGVAITICLLVLLPLSFFSKTRTIAAVGFFAASYIFGLSLWLSGFLITYAYWGAIGVVIGIFMAGVGVVPTGILALVLHGQWLVVGILILGIILTYGVRAFGLYLAAMIDKEVESSEDQESL